MAVARKTRARMSRGARAAAAKPTIRYRAADTIAAKTSKPVATLGNNVSIALILADNGAHVPSAGRGVANRRRSDGSGRQAGPGCAGSAAGTGPDLGRRARLAAAAAAPRARRSRTAAARRVAGGSVAHRLRACRRLA